MAIAAALLLGIVVGGEGVAVADLPSRGSVPVGAMGRSMSESKVYVAVKDVYVHDDGDAVAGCGDYIYPVVYVPGGPGMYVRNGTAAFGKFESWCSDTFYASFPHGPQNIMTMVRSPGESVDLLANFFEHDTYTVMQVSGGVHIVVPDAGYYKDYQFQIEGSAGGQHARMTITLRVSTAKN